MSQTAVRFLVFFAVFADAINKHEEGFYVECIKDDEEDAVVIYEDRLPWEMSDRVKNMTEDDMTDIFNKYLEVLGLAGEVEVGRQSAEIWG